MGKCVQLVCGPAGSGKSTYVSALQQHCQNARRKVHVANMDPGADHFNYEVAFDVRVSWLAFPSFGASEFNFNAVVHAVKFVSFNSPDGSHVAVKCMLREFVLRVARKLAMRPIARH